MTAPVTTTAPIACIDCSALPAPRPVAGESLSECPSCGGVRVSRPVLNRLRGMSPAAHPLLAAPPPGDGAASKMARIRRCPACQTTVLSHTFGGGNVRVESCEACDLVFLEKGRLAAIVKESRDGIEMSDDAKAVLHHERMMAAGRRFTAADFGVGTAALTALIVFFRIAVRTAFSTAAIGAAGLVAVGFLVYHRRRWGRQRTEEAARMERLEQAELFRLEQVEREKVRREAAASDGRPATVVDSRPTPVIESRPAARSSKPRPCPVCKAKLPEGTTHCAACDSDFG